MVRRNPPVLPADTTPDVWRRQMDAIRRRSVADRIAEWEALNEQVSRLEAEAVRRRHPDYSDRQVLLVCARLRYGDDLVSAAWPDEPLLEAMIDLSRALGIVASAFDADGIEYLVVGSIAAAVWGVARTTRDVDVVAVIDVDQVEPVLESLNRSDLYVPANDARRAVTAGGPFNVLDPESGGKVDIFVARPTDDFARSRIERRIRAELLGTTTWIATPEDVILGKLRWRLTSRSEVQWRDCAEIAGVCDLDSAYLDIWAPLLGVTEDLGDLRREVERARRSED